VKSGPVIVKIYYPSLQNFLMDLPEILYRYAHMPSRNFDFLEYLFGEKTDTGDVIMSFVKIGAVKATLYLRA
jgi:hypothetical protein